jgi:hypothetical protein
MHHECPTIPKSMSSRKLFLFLKQAIPCEKETEKKQTGEQYHPTISQSVGK